MDKALSHAEPACDPQLDEEELIEELTGLLHVSRLSDGFGFDILGWLPLGADAPPTAVCLEVKSTRDGKFHLSRNEWERAKWFHDRGEGERYVVLVVHRSSGSEPPSASTSSPTPCIWWRPSRSPRSTMATNCRIAWRRKDRSAGRCLELLALEWFSTDEETDGSS